MEFASYLAGEKWSDHPDCTHPLLATLARAVNDFSSPGARARLVPLVPRVIGLASGDRAVHVRVAVRAAAASVPVARVDRQRALAVGLLTGERLAGPDSTLALEARRALDEVPDAEAWARAFAAVHGPGHEPLFLRRGAMALVNLAVVGVAEACVPDADARLLRMLESAILDFKCAAAPTGVPDDSRVLQFAS
jgi:hypothetical protein